MGWKDWSYWLRGGIIGFFISTIFFWVKLILTTSYTEPPICDYDGGWEILGQPCPIPEFIISNYKEEIIIFTILLAFIGWIYGKIKSNKNNLEKKSGKRK
ncbi:MAG: hypothetical protein Q7R87_00350 [Nanoarchaeota archaeon]|nr:hypothetical protein [Nanoarchaeota archaeon]